MTRSRVVVPVRIADAARLEQRLVLSGNGSLLSFFHVVQVLLGFGIPFWVARERAWQAALPALGVGARSVWTLRRRMVLDGRLRRTAGVAVGIFFVASRNFVVDAHRKNTTLHEGSQEVYDPCAPALLAESREKAGGK